MKLTRRLFFLMALGTLVFMSAIGLLIVHFAQAQSITDLFLSGLPVGQQLLIGSAYGICSALLGVLLMSHSFFKDVAGFFDGVFAGADIRFIDVLFISVSAGVGEELFFRAGLQPFLGIWLTAILFIFVHGYLDPRRGFNWFLIGVMMVFLSAGFGYLYEYCGIFSAMIAHTLYDIIVILNIQRKGRIRSRVLNKPIS